MSILDNNSQIEINKPIRVANSIKGSARQTFQMMVNAFNIGSKTFWKNPNATPSEIAAALGTDAKEIFQLHYALGQLIGSIKPEAIEQGLLVIGQFTMNDDGTVTISDSLPNPSGSV